MPRDYDVVIVGAGMVGASLACALAPTGLRIAVIEAVTVKHNQQPSYDDRAITLTPSSQRILDHVGIWQQIQSTAIKKIHVSEQGHFGFVRLDAMAVDHTELGHVVVARTLGRSLHDRMSALVNITLICPAKLQHFQRTEAGMTIKILRSDRVETITTGLLVGADGSRSLTRQLAGINTHEHDFNQTAIVSHVTTQRPNEATAYERFTPHGPIALLPIGSHRSVSVFTVDSADRERYLTMSDAQFSQSLEIEFGRRLGRIEQTRPRHSYPVVFIVADQQYQPQLILLGNAAHTLHPNAAQGFNLGLRDVAGLAECISEGIENGLVIDDSGILERYSRLRRSDQQRVLRFTNRLARSFYNNFPLLPTARNMAMLMLDTMPDFKSSFIKKAMGISGLQPKLVSGQV